jgi:hypothetical protein
MCPGKISAGISTKHQGRNILKNQMHHMWCIFFCTKTDFDFKDTLIDMTPCLINEDERGFF